MDILNEVNKGSERPEPNMDGVDFDCHTCGTRVERAYYDRKEDKLYWWCEDDHESMIEEVGLDI